MDFFQIDTMVEVIVSGKCNVIVIFSLTFWRKYLCETVIYDILWMFSIK